MFIYEACANTAIVRLRGRAPRAERLVDYATHLGAAMPSPNPQARRDRSHGEVAGYTQGRWRRGGDRMSGREADLFSEVFL